VLLRRAAFVASARRDSEDLVAAVQAGQPTAIFEDPLPAPMTGARRHVGAAQPMGPMAMFGGGGGQPEGRRRPAPAGAGREVGGRRAAGDGAGGLRAVRRLAGLQPASEVELPLQFVFIDAKLGDGAAAGFNALARSRPACRKCCFRFPGWPRTSRPARRGRCSRSGHPLRHDRRAAGDGNRGDMRRCGNFEQPGKQAHGVGRWPSSGSRGGRQADPRSS